MPVLTLPGYVLYFLTAWNRLKHLLALKILSVDLSYAYKCMF